MPLSSPDCNALGHFVWGVMEREMNSRPYNTKEVHKAAIRDAIANMDRDDVTKARSSFRSRLEKVMGADGSYIL